MFLFFVRFSGIANILGQTVNWRQTVETVVFVMLKSTKYFYSIVEVQLVYDFLCNCIKFKMDPIFHRYKVLLIVNTFVGGPSLVFPR